jgi:hypothetical protein
MPKLKGAAKAAFLKRMAAGRKKASRSPAKNGARKKSKPARKPQAKHRPHPAAPRKNARKAPRKNAQKPTSKAKLIQAIALRFKKARTYKGNRNPGDDMAEAEAMYEQFHGRPAARIIEHEETHEYRSELAELGKLLFLRIKLPGVGNAEFEDFGNCQVACTPDGASIYFVGGKQQIDVEGLGIRSDKDYIELGECTMIRYLTKKGFHNFESTDYWHKFGEEDGIRPVLAYDQINQKLFLVGGNYQVRPEGIVN